jgi:DNA-binding beta-propeller fold protein YncE
MGLNRRHPLLTGRLVATVSFSPGLIAGSRWASRSHGRAVFIREEVSLFALHITVNYCSICKSSGKHSRKHMMLISILRTYQKDQGAGKLGKPGPYPTSKRTADPYRVGTGLVPAPDSRSFVGACLFLALFLLVGLFPRTALADGGAPQLAYVAGAARGIGIIDIAQRRVSGTISVAGNPRTILLSLDGHALYVTQPTLGQVAVIAAKTGKTLCAAKIPGQPSLLALSLDTTVLYVAGQGDTSVRALNPDTCAVERTFETHQPVYGIAVAASTAPNATPLTPNQLWITGTTSLTVYEVTGHLLGTVPIAGGPQYISIPGGFTAYVTTRQGSVVAVDLYTRRVIGTLLSGGQFGPMDYNAITGEIYVPDQKRSQLDVLMPVALGTLPLPQEPVRVIHLNSSPQSVAITNDGQFGFVALANSHVLMLDIPGHSTIADIAVGGTPHFIITGLYPPATPPPSTSQQTTPTPSTEPPIDNLMLMISLGLAIILLTGICLLWWRYAQRRPGKQGHAEIPGKQGHTGVKEGDRKGRLY